MGNVKTNQLAVMKSTLLFVVVSRIIQGCTTKPYVAPTNSETLRKALDSITLEDGVDQQEASIIADSYFWFYGKLACAGLSIPEDKCVEEQSKKTLSKAVFMIYLSIGCIRCLSDYGFNPFKVPFEERGLPILLRMLFWPITVSNDIYWWYVKRKRRKEKNPKTPKNNK